MILPSTGEPVASTLLLGLTMFHADASAALVQDGEANPVKVLTLSPRAHARKMPNAGLLLAGSSKS
jgi:hypothetical protein